MRDKPLFVTRPFLPPLQSFMSSLEEIWASGQLTNGGPFHERLERALAEHLGVRHLSLVANGTLALIAAIRALGVSGDVVTTPFSFVATANALLWNGITPVFADIDPETLDLSPDAVEAAITPRTTAILPVHVYGRPCDQIALQRIADRHGLKVIYDAAHAMGVRGHGCNLLTQGDASALSFHATKVFHTFEGGAVVCRDAATKAEVDRLRNHGFDGDSRLLAAGFNAKLNEVQAAFGLLHLAHLDDVIARRQAVDARYRSELAEVDGIRCLALPDGVRNNYGYFPILVEPYFPLGRDELQSCLRQEEIHARRYFFPLISDFAPYRALPGAGPGCLPVASNVAARVLCLPIFPEMAAADVDDVVAAIRRAAAEPRSRSARKAPGG